MQPSVREQHFAGYKHKANVQQYYQQFEEQQTQSLIDQEVKEILCQTVAAFAQQQIGGAFHQNLATLQSGYGPVSGGAPPTCRPPVTQAPASNGPTPQYYPNGNGPAQPQQQQ
jgi:U1 small nuclear ribonucleoprotein C